MHSVFKVILLWGDGLGVMGSQVQPILLVTCRAFVWCLLDEPISESAMQGHTLSVMPLGQGHAWKQAAIFIFEYASVRRCCEKTGWLLRGCGLKLCF